MKNTLLILVLISSSFFGFGQEQSFPKFEMDVNCYSSSIKSQGRTGTCWSFSASSFLESEYQKKTQKEIDLSEIFTVRNIYFDKAEKYLRYHGLNNFSQGSLGHDVIRSYHENGIVPESVYSGLLEDSVHNHSAMANELKGFLDSMLANKPIEADWKKGFDAILHKYIGTPPEMFEYEGVLYNPQSFAKKFIGLDKENYIGFTSFTHHPTYSKFDLEVPDNYSHGLYHNLELDDLIDVMNEALKQGYTIEWDGDVSEKGFRTRQGVAVWNNDSADLSKLPVLPNEGTVSANLRQELFDNHKTTDDHLMHIVGLAHTPEGKTFYLTKNSWGTRAGNGGFMYMSEAYIKMKTVCIIINEKAVPAKIKAQLKDI